MLPSRARRSRCRRGGDQGWRSPRGCGRRRCAGSEGSRTSPWSVRSAVGGEGTRRRCRFSRGAARTTVGGPGGREESAGWPRHDAGPKTRKVRPMVDRRGRRGRRASRAPYGLVRSVRGTGAPSGLMRGRRPCGDVLPLDLPPGLVGHGAAPVGGARTSGRASSPRSVSRWRRISRISLGLAVNKAAGPGEGRGADGGGQRRPVVLAAVHPAQVELGGREQRHLVLGAVAARRTTATASGSRTSSDAAIAGSADSSPTSRCQSAPGSGSEVDLGLGQDQHVPRGVQRTAHGAGPRPRRRGPRSRVNSLCVGVPGGARCSGGGPGSSVAVHRVAQARPGRRWGRTTRRSVGDRSR